MTDVVTEYCVGGVSLVWSAAGPYPYTIGGK